MMNTLRNIAYRGDVVTALRINYGLDRKLAASVAGLPHSADITAYRSAGIPAVELAHQLVADFTVER